jgi:flagellar hook-length control protein FliK
MTNGLSSPKATDRPPGPTPEAARGAPPPSDAFAGMLDAQQARTATAEGQSPEKSAPADDSAAPTPVETPAPDDGTKADPTTAVAAAVLAALPVPVAPAAATPEATATPVVASVATPATAVPNVQIEAPSVSAEVAVPQSAPEQAVAAPVAVEAPAAVGTTPLTVAKPEAPIQAPAAQQVAPAQPKAEAQPAAAPPPSQPVGAPAATAPQSGEQPSGGQPQPQAKQAPVPAPAPQQQAPAAQTAAPNAPAAAPPAEAAHPALSTATATPVPLARAAEAVEHVLRVATSRGGVTHARIALRPAELGSIDVHIRSTAEGLVARVVAHTAQSVQTLQDAANDLRQSLEEHGLNLMSLDIGGPSERNAGRAGSDAGDQAPANGDSPAAAEADDTATETSTLRLPTGVLVDVLA